MKSIFFIIAFMLTSVVCATTVNLESSNTAEKENNEFINSFESVLLVEDLFAPCTVTVTVNIPDDNGKIIGSGTSTVTVNTHGDNTAANCMSAHTQANMYAEMAVYISPPNYA